MSAVVCHSLGPHQCAIPACACLSVPQFPAKLVPLEGDGSRGGRGQQHRLVRRVVFSRRAVLSASCGCCCMRMDFTAALIALCCAPYLLLRVLHEAERLFFPSCDRPTLLRASIVPPLFIHWCRVGRRSKVGRYQLEQMAKLMMEVMRLNSKLVKGLKECRRRGGPPRIRRSVFHRVSVSPRPSNIRVPFHGCLPSCFAVCSLWTCLSAFLPACCLLWASRVSCKYPSYLTCYFCCSTKC